MSHSYLSLHINEPNFTLTRLFIKESLEYPFICECEGFIEHIQSDINPKSNFHPKALINQITHLIIPDKNIKSQSK